MKSSATACLVAVFAGVGVLLAWLKIRSEVSEPPKVAPIVIEGPLKHVVTAPQLATTREMTGREAPAFVAQGTDGKSYDLGELSRRGPVVLIFVKDGCPCSESAQPYFNALERAYGSRVRFLGVIDGDGEVARRWATRHRAAYVLLSDPERRIIREYKATNSAYLAIVRAGGTIETYWPGYSQEMLREASQRLARLADVPEEPLEVSGAPEELYTGCPYEIDDAS